MEEQPNINTIEGSSGECLTWTEIQMMILQQDEKVHRLFESYIGIRDKFGLTKLSKTFHFLRDKIDAVKEFGENLILRYILKQTVHSYEISTDDICNMTNLIHDESRQFLTSTLTQTIDYCVDYMKREVETDLPVRWTEIFGKLVAVLATRGEFNYKIESMVGKEFQSRVVASICSIPWGKNNAIPRIAALREIPCLSSSEVEVILVRAGDSLNDLEYNEIPPFAYQLILLAGQINPSRLVYYFDKYFISMNTIDENIDEDILEPIDRTFNEKKKALGSTVLHFIQYAKSEPILQKELLRRIRASQYDHELIMGPFMLSVALGLTSIEHIKEKVLCCLRTALLRRISDFHLKQETAFYSSLVDSELDKLTHVFKKVLEAKSIELDFMLDGLKELGIWLVNSDQLQGESQLSRNVCHELGNYLLCSIVKRHEDYLSGIINEFLKRQASIRNIECLANCLSSVGAKLAHKKFSARLYELVYQLPVLSVERAKLIITAMVPALRISSDLLGHLLMVIRKTIIKPKDLMGWFCLSACLSSVFRKRSASHLCNIQDCLNLIRSIEARRVSVASIILLLSTSTIVVADIPKPQVRDKTSHWTFSQTDFSKLEGFPSNHPHTDDEVFENNSKNKSICFEILPILLRFLSNPVEVREDVYKGVGIIIQKNPELTRALSHQLLMHIYQYMSSDKKCMRLNKILSFDPNGDIIILDNIGMLIQAIATLTLRRQQNLHICEDIEEENGPRSISHSETVLMTFYRVALKTKLSDFEKMTSDVIASSKGQSEPLEFVRAVRNVYIIQFLQILEALIEFVSMGGPQRALRGSTGEDQSNDDAMKIKPLFEKFLEFETILASKCNTNATGSQATNKVKIHVTLVGSRSDDSNRNATISNYNAVLDQQHKGNPGTSKTTTKPPSKIRQIFSHIYSEESLTKTLALLHRREISNDDTTTDVKKNSKFEIFILGAMKQKLIGLKKNKIQHDTDPLPDSPIILEELTKSIHLLWHEELITVNDMKAPIRTRREIEPDTFYQLLEYRIELISEILEFGFEKYPLLRRKIFAEFVQEPTKSYEEIFEIFLNQWTNYFDHVVFLISRSEIRTLSDRLLPYMFRILRTFVTGLQSESISVLEKLVNWFVNFLTNKPSKNIETSCVLLESILHPFILVCSKNQKHPSLLLSLAKNAHFILGDINDEEIVPEEQRWLITRETAPIVIFHYGVYVDKTLELITRVLDRLNLPYSYSRKEMMRKLRSSCCRMMLYVMELLKHLVHCKISAKDRCGTTLQKTLSQYFNVMTSVVANMVRCHVYESKFSSDPSPSFECPRFETLVQRIGSDFKSSIEAFVLHLEQIRRNDSSAAGSGTSQSVKNVAKNKFAKDRRTFPAPTYSMEKYEQQLILLSKKIKDDSLLDGTRHSAARDFKILINKLPTFKQYPETEDEEADDQVLSKKARTTLRQVSRPKSKIGGQDEEVSKQIKTIPRKYDIPHLNEFPGRSSGHPYPSAERAVCEANRPRSEEETESNQSNLLVPHISDILWATNASYDASSSSCQDGLTATGFNQDSNYISDKGKNLHNCFTQNTLTSQGLTNPTQQSDTSSGTPTIRRRLGLSGGRKRKPN